MSAAGGPGSRLGGGVPNGSVLDSLPYQGTGGRVPEARGQVRVGTNRWLRHPSRDGGDCKLVRPDLHPSSLPQMERGPKCKPGKNGHTPVGERGEARLTLRCWPLRLSASIFAWPVVQLVEHLTLDQRVVGSSPTGPVFISLKPFHGPTPRRHSDCGGLCRRRSAQQVRKLRTLALRVGRGHAVLARASSYRTVNGTGVG